MRERRLAQRAVAAALRIAAATVSHASAIAVHGLPLLTVPDRPCLTLPPSLRARETDLHMHRQPIPADQFSRRFRFQVTDVARSCLDLTREAGLAAGAVAADAALHRGLCQLVDLEAVYRTSCRGRAGLPSGRQLLRSVDGNCESPLETVSRLSMAGLTQPRSQVTLRTPGGDFLARVGFFWDELGVVGEADGQAKYTGDELWREKLRQDALTEHGLVVQRWGWRTARDPARLAALLERAFQRAQLLRQAGIQPRVIASPSPLRAPIQLRVIASPSPLRGPNRQESGL